VNVLPPSSGSKCKQTKKHNRISGSYGVGYAESQPIFRRKMSPPSSGSKKSKARNQHEAGSKRWLCLLLGKFLLALGSTVILGSIPV
jgi:hypothetical protein